MLCRMFFLLHPPLVKHCVTNNRIKPNTDFVYCYLPHQKHFSPILRPIATLSCYNIHCICICTSKFIVERWKWVLIKTLWTKCASQFEVHIYPLKFNWINKLGLIDLGLFHLTFSLSSISLSLEYEVFGETLNSVLYYIFRIITVFLYALGFSDNFDVIKIIISICVI